MNQLWEINWVLWFQNIGEGFKPIMLFFTQLGFPITYILLIATLYWSVESRLGQRFAVFVLFGGSINEILKRIFHLPRPFWVNSQVLPIGSSSTSFGFPSGHAQTSIVWIYFGNYVIKWWGWVLTFLFIIMIGLSRIYLGAHFLTQVVTGWIIGGLLMVLFVQFENYVINWMKSKPRISQLFTVFVFSFILLLIGWISVKLLENWKIPEVWVEIVTPHLEENEIFDPIKFESIVTSVAALCGALVGMIFMSHSGGFQTSGSLIKRGIRLLVGIVSLIFLVVIFSVLGNLLGIPKESGILAWSWQFISIFLLLFVIFYPVPLLFRRFRLANF